MTEPGATPAGATNNRIIRVAQKENSLRDSFMAERFDVPGPIRLRRSYIIASTPRCGSTFLCTRLCATGVLGVPAEYFGYQKRDGKKMIARLAATSPADYLQKLLACRTSTNGTFGLNVEFNDFDEALRRIPRLLDTLSPVTYIYLDRQDRLVQAAFMAKAVQTVGRSAKEIASEQTADGGRSAEKRPPKAARYDRDLISQWLGRIERQRLEWTRWFDRARVVPFVVTYENLITKPAGVVESIVELIGAQSDVPQKLRVPLAERPSDRISVQWARRFEHEIANGIQESESGAPNAVSGSDTRIGESDTAHIFDRYERLTGTAEPAAAKRLRRRYDAIIGRNRKLFKNARVLDVRSGEGYWALASLDAGAAHVTGVDSQGKVLAAARAYFGKMGIDSKSYQFDERKILEALSSFEPGAFDVILCREISPDPHLFFRSLQHLRPKHVVMDIRMAGRKEPTLVLRVRQRELEQKTGERSLALTGVPNHQLIERLCEHFGFRCRVVDWHTMGISDWTGVSDYKRNGRRTYVLDRITSHDPSTPLEAHVWRGKQGARHAR